MKTNEVVFILDKSGSMESLTADTIGGFNGILKEQKENNADGKVFVSTVLFNEESQVLYDREDIDNIRNMTKKDYCASGSTALIDALGDSIKHIKNVHKYIRPEDVPEHTLFVIITDGEENSSYKYSSNEVKKMIKKQQEDADWEFLFVGANIDAVNTAKNYGINFDDAFDYCADNKGTNILYEALSNKITATRKCLANKKASNVCMAAVRKDYAKRKKQRRK